MRAILACAGAMLALAACSQGASPPAANNDSAAPSAAAPEASTPTTAGGVSMPRPRVGLWRMAMNLGPGIPAIPREVCLTEQDVANATAFSAPGGAAGGGDCDPTQMTREGDAIVGATTCRVNGRTTTSRIRLTGDTQSHYQMEMTSDGAGAGQVMRVDATYVGPCPG